jgi:hypothetical protein
MSIDSNSSCCVSNARAFQNKYAIDTRGISSINATYVGSLWGPSSLAFWMGCRRHPAWVATLVRGRARTPNGNQPCFRTHDTRYDRAISIYIRALRVVIVRISHAMRARHVGVYASPFLTMQDPYGISRVWPFGCRTHPKSLRDLDPSGIRKQTSSK